MLSSCGDALKVECAGGLLLQRYGTSIDFHAVLFSSFLSDLRDFLRATKYKQFVDANLPVGSVSCCWQFST